MYIGLRKNAGDDWTEADRYAPKLERYIERDLRELLREKGCLFYKFVSPGNDGVPDRIVITPAGRVVFVELKTETGVVSQMQKHQIARLQAHGAEVCVLRGWDEAKKFAEEVCGGGDAQ